VYPTARRGIPAPIEAEKETADGTRVTFYFENLSYVARWLLRFGTQAKVEHPESLQKLVRHEAREIRALYA